MDGLMDVCIDDDLTDEEKKSLIECEREYSEHPENFVVWKKHDWQTCEER